MPRVAPEIVRCVYCGYDTLSYQLVKQIPDAKCPKLFVKSELVSIEGGPMKDDEYVCLDHEELFRIKYTQFERGQPFFKGFLCSTTNGQKSLVCSLCLSCDTYRFHCVNSIKALPLKNFIINELHVKGKRPTRKGTGISEVDHLCHKCYQGVKNNMMLGFYSPRKKLKPKSVKITVPDQADQSRETTVDTDEQRICVHCGRDKTDGKWRKVEGIITHWVEIVRNFSEKAHLQDLEKAKYIHAAGSRKCLPKLKQEVRSIAKCMHCKKALTPEKDIMKLSKDQLQLAEQWICIQETGEPLCYKYEMHKKCFEEIEMLLTIDKENPAANYDAGDNDSSVEAVVIERERLLEDLMRESLADQMKNAIPVHITTFFDSMIEAFEDCVNSLGGSPIPMPSKHELENELQKIMSVNQNYHIHLSKTKKRGRYILDTEWDIVADYYELYQNTLKTPLLDSDASTKNIRADEMFHCAKEIRTRLQDGAKLCESYGKYPELLPSLKLEDLLFTGVQMKFENSTEAIPPVEPFLFNLCYYLFCSDKEAKVFEDSFDPTWGHVYVNGFSKKSRPFYSRVLMFVFDLLHQSNKNNIYPLHVLMSDLVANTKPTKLMNYLNFHRKCASSRKFDEYRSTIASNIKRLKAEGKVLGLIDEIFTYIHMDNLEQYSKHSRDPSQALTSSLVIGTQQPLPKSTLMQMKEEDYTDSDQFVPLASLSGDEDMDLLDDETIAEPEQEMTIEAEDENERTSETCLERNKEDSEIHFVINREEMEKEKLDKADNEEKTENLEELGEEENEEIKYRIENEEESENQEVLGKEDNEEMKHRIENEEESENQEVLGEEDNEESQYGIENEEKSENQEELGKEDNEEMKHRIENEEESENQEVLGEEDNEEMECRIENKEESEKQEVLGEEDDEKMKYRIENEEEKEFEEEMEEEMEEERKTQLNPIEDQTELEELNGADLMEEEETQTESDTSQSQSSPSQYSQSSQTSQDSEYLFDDTKVGTIGMIPLTQKRKTRSSSVKESEEGVLLEIPEASVCLHPRKKRLRLHYENDHTKIGKYSTPTSTIQERRQCKVEDFIMNLEEKALLKNLNMDVLVHSLLQSKGSREVDDGNVQQLVPSFKEVMAWEQAVVPKTETVYLELIPGKPDTLDTLLYALGLVKELFVEKLHYKNVMVCGDGKTVNLLYQIKDEYGEEMEWLHVMLGSWHLLKDYLGVFCKKYENVFIRHLLSKVLSKGNVDAVIGCKTWWKSHQYCLWMMSALIRENLSKFIEKENDSTTEFLLQAEKTVKALEIEEEKISENNIKDFLDEKNILKGMFAQTYPKYEEYLSDGYSNDDQFALFINIVEDYQAYHAMYIAIRSSSWTLRIAALKSMATKFVRSGAVLYKWLVLRHLADIATYPKTVKERLEGGAWVSALKDGKGVTLARDEFHERTASKDIQIVMPKQLTPENMQILTQYSTYGASSRRNLLDQFFPQDRDIDSFKLSKGCSTSWVNTQEKQILIFQKLLSTESPFLSDNRLLRQPFTDVIAKNSLRIEILGRTDFGEPRKDHGEEIVISYVVPRFCRRMHDMAAEKMPMPKNVLILFPSKRKSTPSNQQSLKEKEKVVDVLAAGIAKLSSGDPTSTVNIRHLQMSNSPGLLAEDEEKPYCKKTKSDWRKQMEKQYSSAFTRPILNPITTVQIRDSMQDIQVAPLRCHLNFSHYFDLFWNTKIKPNFSLAATIIIDFDRQKRDNLAPKDILRETRDSGKGKEKIMNTLVVTDDSLTPGLDWSWSSFLANRENKCQLVHYLSLKLRMANDRLDRNEIVYVSSEGELWRVSNQRTVQVPTSNNHDEADTRMFWLSTLMEGQDIIIRSTDTDILAIAMINQHKLDLQNRNVVIHYGNSSANLIYCHLNKLVESVTHDPTYSLLQVRGLPISRVLGALHFITGCDDLSYLRGFTKNFCMKTFNRHCETICDGSADECNDLFTGNIDRVHNVFVKLLICLYCQRYSQCFSPGDIKLLCSESTEDETLGVVRENTWHKTIVSNNQLPTETAILLHSKRISFVLKLNGDATLPELSNKDHLLHGWKIVSINGKDTMLPDWDTEASKSSLDVIRKAVLKKCGCPKSECRTGFCKCKKASELCTSICTCNNCANREHSTEDGDNGGEGESEGEESEDEEDEDGEHDEYEENDEVDESDELNGPSALDRFIELMQEENPWTLENGDSADVNDLVS